MEYSMGISMGGGDRAERKYESKRKKRCTSISKYNMYITVNIKKGLVLKDFSLKH